MTTVREYQRTSPEDKRDFDKWINSNAILSAIFAVGMVAMALAAIVVPYQSANKHVVAVISTSMSGE